MHQDKISTYLGNKGYTISKSELTVEQEKKIRDDLMITPRVHGGPITNNQPSFPAYRESNNKMYVPHYYGIEHFGPPKKIKISNGETIDLQFNGKLRENQEIVVNTYLNDVSKCEAGGGLLELPCAYGKCLGIDTEILMYDGTIKKVQDVVKGDLLMGDDSTPRTVLSLNIISQLKKKTFIIVHKEFLMNQWIERINQFLPNARIGKIQGQIIDIDNKDIVIGMLQSLSMKEYPLNLFDSFGLTIIDEVHHISSEVFSNTLFKLVTKYMLGLSATMQRKDGTTKVFKMFLGDVIFKGNREEQFNVVIRAIEYKVNDDEFNEVKLDFRGKPAYSSMIVKLCEYNRRSDFILQVITDMLHENPAQQIMILAHNKSLLKYLYDAIVHRNLATVGYYLGGMKEQALKETEGKKIVIATYAMAAEALDIKTLTTLIMATPKTDIEQSVGRILREKHSDPIVVDIVDTHDLFKNQWRKRKTFYKRENYKIIYTTSPNYTTDMSKWDLVFEPKVLKNKKSSTICKGRKKTISEKSHSSTDKSITCDSDTESENEDENNNSDNETTGKCLLSFKKFKK